MPVDVAGFIKQLMTNKYLAPLWFTLGAVFMVLTGLWPYRLNMGTADQRLFISLYFLLLLTLALLLLHHSVPKMPAPLFLLCMSFISLSLLIRIRCLDVVSNDYTAFLSKWVEYFRTHGNLAGLAGSVGDYNVPYLYFLALFSYSSMPDLYLIKLLSVTFDLILAYSVSLLVRLCTQSIYRRAFSFLSILLLPTVILNGAYWAQCDTIYISLAVLAVYFALSDRPVLSVLFITLSFSFKLQAIFVMPVYLLFLYTGRVKFRHILLFPVFFILTALPAILLGKPILEIFSVYFNQIGSYGGRLTLNAPSVFALAPSGKNVSLLSGLGVITAALAVTAILVFLYRRRGRLDIRILLLSAFLFSILIPFLLPKMHDRYFMFADVFSVMFAFGFKRRYFVPLLTVTASYGCYYAYLNGAYLFPLKFGSLFMAAVIACLVYDLVKSLPSYRQPDEPGQTL